MKKVLALVLAIMDVVPLAVIVKPLLVKEPDVPTLPAVPESASRHDGHDPAHSW